MVMGLVRDMAVGAVVGAGVAMAVDGGPRRRPPREEVIVVNGGNGGGKTVIIEESRRGRRRRTSREVVVVQNNGPPPPNRTIIQESRTVTGAPIAHPPVWKNGRRCFQCRNRFTIFRARHHCRNCGNSFCGYHSAKVICIPAYNFRTPVRVCDKCFTYISATITNGPSMVQPGGAPAPMSNSNVTTTVVQNQQPQTVVGGVPNQSTTVVSNFGPNYPPSIQQNTSVGGVNASNGFSEPSRMGSSTTTTGSAVYLSVPNQQTSYNQYQQQPPPPPPPPQQNYQQQPMPYQQNTQQQPNQYQGGQTATAYEVSQNNAVIPEATLVSVQAPTAPSAPYNNDNGNPFNNAPPSGNGNPFDNPPPSSNGNPFNTQQGSKANEY